MCICMDFMRKWAYRREHLLSDEVERVHELCLSEEAEDTDAAEDVGAAVRVLRQNVE